jgi:cytochrome P450
MPFSYGTRACVGQKFAQVEMVLFLARLISQYRIKSITAELDCSNLITNTPDHPVEVKLTKR